MLFVHLVLGRSKDPTHGVGGLSADVMLCSVLEDDDCSDETTHVVKVDQDVAESVEGVHFAYCLSEVGCGIIRVVV